MIKKFKFYRKFYRINTVKKLIKEIDYIMTAKKL